mmetsp:Transcript_12988/g.25806  ORF Transcript_12988/g.25806 Transcript_12988/m.25806 type:complete len:235 (+) Transcript_12988:292-996(+)
MAGSSSGMPIVPLAPLPRLEDDCLPPPTSLDMWDQEAAAAVDAFADMFDEADVVDLETALGAPAMQMQQQQQQMPQSSADGAVADPFGLLARAERLNKKSVWCPPTRSRTSDLPAPPRATSKLSSMIPVLPSMPVIAQSGCGGESFGVAPTGFAVPSARRLLTVEKQKSTQRRDRQERRKETAFTSRQEVAARRRRVKGRFVAAPVFLPATQVYSHDPAPEEVTTSKVTQVASV